MASSLLDRRLQLECGRVAMLDRMLDRRGTNSSGGVHASAPYNLATGTPIGESPLEAESRDLREVRFFTAASRGETEYSAVGKARTNERPAQAGATLKGKVNTQLKLSDPRKWEGSCTTLVRGRGWFFLGLSRGTAVHNRSGHREMASSCYLFL
jgi:hypothetical protein